MISTLLERQKLSLGWKKNLQHSMIPDPKLLHVFRFRGGEVTEQHVDAAYDWCMNLGAPAALVAGAVVATLYENMRSGQLVANKTDSKIAILSKRLTLVLLLSSFVLQIVSIFVTTVTGTMLLSIDFSNRPQPQINSGLGFLKENFEFEYLTSRISFLQGLLNWLAGVALEYTIPRQNGDQVHVYNTMDQFVAVSITSVIVLLLSFYNMHLTFYDNYLHMVISWFRVAVKRYFGTFRPLMCLYVPGLVLSMFLGIKALCEDTRE